MKTLFIQQPKQQKRINVVLGSVFILQGTMNVVKEGMDFSFWLGIFQIVFGVLFFLYTYSIIKPESINAPRIYLGPNDITLYKGMIFNKPKTISHSEIKLIQFKPEQLTVMTNELDFSYSINYEALNKHEIIEELAAYAQEQNIPVERISYRNV